MPNCCTVRQLVAEPVTSQKGTSMKKIARIAAAAALAMSFNAGTFTTASAGGVNDYVKDVCKPLVEAGFFDSVGDCIGNANKSVPAFCKEFFEIIGYKNVGECVSSIRKSI